VKSREFVRDYLVPAGAKLVKKKGDHHIYELPNGKRMVVPMGGGHSEAQPYLVRRLQQLLESETAR
jgi:predicted RNA binding protein YcfA (HicA-like mRNA interferase family)